MNEKETHPTQRKGFKILLLLVPLCLVVLLGCSQEDYVGTYSRTHGSGFESVTLYPDSTFLQVYAAGDRLDSNRGSWEYDPSVSYSHHRLTLYDWIIYEDPYKSKVFNREGEKCIFSTNFSGGCILIDDDLREYNLCK